jgi:hypothetical protein
MYIVPPICLSLTHSQHRSPERVVKDKRIAVSAIFVICSRWQCHHGMNAITKTISLFIADLVAYSLAPGGRACGCGGLYPVFMNVKRFLI